MKTATLDRDVTQSAFQSIPIDQIKPSQHQARKVFDQESIKGLAESMKQEGLLQPIVVREASIVKREAGGDTGPVKDASRDTIYELVSGERRLRAAKLLGWATIEAKVIRTVSEAEAAAKGLVENTQRKNLNPIEEAEGFQELRDMNDSHWTQERIADVMGKDRTYIARSLALLKLPEPVLSGVRQRTLTREHGIELLRLDNANSIKFMANKILKGGWTVKQLRVAIDNKLEKPSSALRTPNSALADPLENVWKEAHQDPDLAYAVFWRAGYGPQKYSAKAKSKLGWEFKVCPQGEGPKTDLVKWMRGVADTIDRTSSAEDGTRKVEVGNLKSSVEDGIRKPEEGNLHSVNQLPHSEFRTPHLSSLRLPQNPQEQSELEALAAQGPGPAYAWIYGKDSPQAKEAAGKSWQDAGASDPVTGVRDMIGLIRDIQDMQSMLKH